MNTPHSTSMRPSSTMARSHATAVAPKKITVNHRSLGAAGGMSNSFGTTVKSEVRDKMQLKNLMVKAQHEQYKNNPVEQRRVQAKIAEKASAIYGIDSKKLLAATKGNYQTKGTQAVVHSSNQVRPQANHGRYGHSLANKVNSK